MYKVKTKLTLRFTEHQTIETCGVVEVWFHTFVTSALEEDVQSASPLGRFTREEKCLVRFE